MDSGHETAGGKHREPGLVRRIDEACDRFEAAWKSGQRPQLGDYLDTVPEAGRGGLLRELLALELEYRRHKGEQPAAEEYRQRFPDYAAEIDEAFAMTPGPATGETQGHTSAKKVAEPRALHVRCPHCRNPIEIVDDNPMADIDCSSCGSSFKLVGDEALSHQTMGGTRRRRQTIGHFELTEQLGSGAFGAVWKARDTQLDRTVAVKIPRKGQLSPEETEKVLREARAAAQLRHPNIVSIHEVGLEGDLIYTVSEFIEGVTLQEWLTGRSFTYQETAALCARISEAIHFAHEQGVIHRDLKPSNLMLDDSREPHIMDFGLAKREAGEITMTVEGQVLGTPAYMSPEQAKGEAHKADRRTDIYSLGVILFELLTGECPFRGNVRMLIKQVIEDEASAPRKLDNRIPRDLETICLKCLEKEPERRYGTNQEVADELHRFLRSEAIHARPISTTARTWRWCRRHPAIAVLSTIALLLSMLVAVVATIGYVQTRIALAKVEFEEKNTGIALGDAKTAWNEAEEARQAAEITLADMYTSYGLVAAEQGDPQEAVLWFANAAARSENDPERELANRVRFRSWSGEFPTPVRAFQHEGQEISEMEFDPTGRYLMVRDKGSKWTTWNLQEERPVRLPSVQGRITAVAWNPAGDRLVLGTPKGDIKIVGFPEGRRFHQLSCKGSIHSLAFSPDGHYLAFASQAVQLWDCKTEELAGAEVSLPARVGWLYFNGDGSRLIIDCVDGLARVYGVSSSGAELTPLFDPVPQVGRWAAQFVDNDRGLLTITGENEVTLWDAATGKRMQSTTIGSDLLSCPTDGGHGATKFMPRG